MSGAIVGNAVPSGGIVVARRFLDRPEEHDLATRKGGVRIVGIGGDPGQSGGLGPRVERVASVLKRVQQVDEPIRVEVGVEGHPQQAAIPELIDLRPDVDERRRQELAGLAVLRGLEDAHDAGLFPDEQAAVRRKRDPHGRERLQPDHQLRDETRVVERFGHGKPPGNTSEGESQKQKGRHTGATRGPTQHPHRTSNSLAEHGVCTAGACMTASPLRKYGEQRSSAPEFPHSCELSGESPPRKGRQWITGVIVRRGSEAAHLQRTMKKIRGTNCRIRDSRAHLTHRLLVIPSAREAAYPGPGGTASR